tara:strand:- start:1 stop:147 length:147 start_codon:yes stop_codon:yes gene_type:complete
VFKRLVEKAIDVVEGVLREMELFDDIIKIEDKIFTNKKTLCIKARGFK